MTAVRTAQLRLASSQQSKAYLSPAGNAAYCRHMEALVFGADHPVIGDGRLHSVQTPGAGGGLRAAAELIKAASADATVWVPGPTWDQQLLILEYTGVRVRNYPYYDISAPGVRFDEMMAALESATPGDAILLQGCCHNPTGADLTGGQWLELGQLLLRRGLIPFIDIVYQGLGDGREEDAHGVRLLASLVPEMIVVSSSSKSFAAYRDRAGCLSLLLERPGPALLNAARHVSRITRSLYFMPPDFGAAIVAEILDDPNLRTVWEEELDQMRRRIVAQRLALRRRLEDEAGLDFSFLTDQKGMFSLVGLSFEEVEELGHRHGIYLMPEGRLNFAAITDERIGQVAHGIGDMIRRRARGPAPGRSAGRA